MKLCLHCNQYFDEPVEKCPTDGTILENVGKDPLIGALINNRYLVDSVIGKGSSGIVYKARRLGRGEMVVAIKVLHSYIGAAGSSLDRFLREAQAASRLRNPHIITIWDTGVTEDGQPYFVMDYSEGTTLGCLIKEQGNIEPKRVLSLLRQICEALGEAHRLGIVHRDLKPENIVLQESGHGHDYVKLLDFGIADSPQHAQSSFKLEKPRTVSGSPAYMSPEQCQGLDLDGRSDIYSLAIVVFEMLTGCRPFPQLDNVNVMVLHVNEIPMTLSDVRPDLEFPPDVENVIARALSKQPFERQTSVQEFLLEFEMAWQNQGNPLSALAKAVVQQRTILNESMSALTKEKYAKAITADELVIKEGNEVVSAWGNVSMESSNKATTVLDNDASLIVPNNTSNDEASRVNESKDKLAKQEELTKKAELAKPAELAKGEELDKETELAKQTRLAKDKELVKQAELAQQKLLEAAKNSHLWPAVPAEQMSVQESIKEQSATRGKTIDRLMDAAKRGQTQQQISRRNLPNPESLKPTLPRLETISPIANNEPFTSSKNLMPDLNIQTPPSVQTSSSTSGWYAAPNKEVSLNQGINTSFVNLGNVPGAKFANAAKLHNSGIRHVANADPRASIPTTEAVESYSKRAMSHNRLSSGFNNEVQLPTDILGTEQQYLRSKSQELLTSSHHGVESAQNEEFYIKQKYRNSLSRLEGWKKARRADNSLISTRARAAALKAETVRPPINLWYFAITIIISACVLACAYVVYSALIAPIPPVTSLDVLLSSGKYGEVIDILEGKQLSEPLTETERDELNEAYLHVAKQNLDRNKPDQALPLLSRIDPKSSSAAEANRLKEEITKNKNLIETE